MTGFMTPLLTQLGRMTPVHSLGRICELQADSLWIEGLTHVAALGDAIEVGGRRAEILRICDGRCQAAPEERMDGLMVGAPVRHLGPVTVSPGRHWIGRVIDPDGAPLDGRPLYPGPAICPLHCAPPPATRRRALGPRLGTGLALFDTLLPIVRGQRLGLFAGSGVGKSTLLSDLAKGVQADVIVIGLIGERGREVRDFVEDTLGPEGLARAVVVAATSDRSALVRQRAAWTMMSVAEFFRDQGAHVLLLADSITRFAQAHREVSVASGEPAALGGYPASMAQAVMSLCERAGPGGPGQGDITAVLSVLVAGSDMEEPVADTLRGVLDGHVVLDREIAERGRFPAVDLLRSVSRSLPRAASAEENRLIATARRHLGAYDRAELMVQSGLYAAGSDPAVDAALRVWPALDSFLAERSSGAEQGFATLSRLLDAAEDVTPPPEAG